MKTHADIINGLGLRPLASELGHKNPSTVQGWRDRNCIPTDHWTALVQAAERLGKPISPVDLMPAELRDVA